MRRWLAAALLALVAPLVPLACDSGRLVGGECRKGLTDCDGKCVSLPDDADNCGSCGNTCPAGEACIAGVCEGEADGGADASMDGATDAADGATDGSTDGGDASLDGGDASMDGGDGSTDGGGDGSTDGGGDGSTGDGGGDGSTGDGGQCTPPFDRPTACGDCNTQCSGATPVCAPVDGGFACVPLCDPPLTNCGGMCVDTNTDPRHCGMCFNVCPSGICQAGMCVGATSGHIVVACADYRQSFQSSPQTTLLGNAIFLAPKNPVRVLAYEEFANETVTTQVDQTIDWAGQARGRTATITKASSAGQVTADLNIFDYEALLIYDQQFGNAGLLSNRALAMQMAIDQFARAGGVVVVLGGPGGAMDRFVTDANLLSVSGQTDITFDVVQNVAPADAIGINVLSPFIALNRTCTWTTSTPSDPTTVWVVTDQPGDGGTAAPVVVHRVITP